jgi:hypothetical protein
MVMSKSLGEAMAKGEAVIFTDEAKTLPVQVYLNPGRELEVLQLLETKGIIKILRPAKPVSKKKKLTDKEILELNGWVIDCESPFEISKDCVTFATGEAARAVVDQLRAEQ